MTARSSSTGARKTAGLLGAFVSAVAVVCAGAFLGAGQMTDAAFTDVEGARANIAAGRLPAGLDIECKRNIILLGGNEAVVSWTPSSPLPAGARYEVTVTQGSTSRTTLQDTTSFKINPGLLGLGGLLDWLTVGSRVTISARVVLTTDAGSIAWFGPTGSKGVNLAIIGIAGIGGATCA